MFGFRRKKRTPRRYVKRVNLTQNDKVIYNGEPGVVTSVLPVKQGKHGLPKGPLYDFTYVLRVGTPGKIVTVTPTTKGLRKVKKK